jgi:hypothetical protein
MSYAVWGGRIKMDSAIEIWKCEVEEVFTAPFFIPVLPENWESFWTQNGQIKDKDAEFVATPLGTLFARRVKLVEKCVIPDKLFYQVPEDY